MREEYELESDSVAMFLYEKEYIQSIEQFIPLSNLYNEYKQCCLEDGYKPLQKTNFKKRLVKNKYWVTRKNRGLVVYAELIGQESYLKK